MKFTFDQIKTCVELIQTMIREKGIRYVNAGGCGVFASLLADRMTSVGIPEDDIKIIVYGDGGSCADMCEIEQKMREEGRDLSNLYDWNEVGTNFGHVRVCWNDHIFDAEARTDLLSNNQSWRFSDLCDGHVSLEAMRELSKSKDWNSLFNRDQIPELQKTIDKAFASLV